jgi:hypothetical protein
MKGLDSYFETQLNRHQERIDNMKTYKVTASYVTYCTAEIEAESLEEAQAIAENLDGGSFEPDKHGGDDWSIEAVEEVTE